MTIDRHAAEKGLLSGKAIPTIATLLGGVLISGLLGITIAADKVLTPNADAPIIRTAPAPHIPIVTRPTHPRAIEVGVAPLQSVDGALREVAQVLSQASGPTAPPVQAQAAATGDAGLSVTSAKPEAKSSPLRLKASKDKRRSGGAQLLSTAAKDGKSGAAPGKGRANGKAKAGHPKKR